MGILVTVVASNFTRLLEVDEQERLEKELVGLFNKAKTEAVIKNQYVYIHFHHITNEYSEVDDWCVVLTNKETITTCETKDGTIAIVEGKSFKKVKIKRTEMYQKLNFDPVSAKSNFTHDEEYVDVLSFYSQDKNKVTSLRSHFMGKIGVYSY